jgi:prefoldin subunit 5
VCLSCADNYIKSHVFLDELSGENDTLKTALNDLRSKLDVSETSVQHLVSEHKRLDGLLSHADRISAQHQLESETLQRTVVTLKEENFTALRNRDAVIEKLETQCDELNKKIVSLNAALLEEIRRAGMF